MNIVVYGSLTSSSPSDDSRHHELIPLQVDSTAQKRMQLIASAAEGFTPYGDTPAVPLDLVDISGFNAVAIQQPALDAAIHTLALAQLGATSKNAGLLLHAQREYGRSLRLLSYHITRSHSSKVWDQQVASAIVLLKFCEVRPNLYWWMIQEVSLKCPPNYSLSKHCTSRSPSAYTTLVFGAST
jgi:hypothetical protein